MLPSRNLQPAVTHFNEWTLSQIAGRFVEVCGFHNSSALTLTLTMVLDAQRHSEPVGWVSSTESIFYPPDAAGLGIDLKSLVIVRVPNFDAIARAGEKLIRSGGFGLVVLDIDVAAIPMPLQTRLTGLAHHHHSALVCLTERHGKMSSLGSLVPLRVNAERKRIAPSEFACSLRVLKDKRRGPTWRHEQTYHAPPGLC